MGKLNLKQNSFKTYGKKTSTSKKHKVLVCMNRRMIDNKVAKAIKSLINDRPSQSDTSSGDEFDKRLKHGIVNSSVSR